MTYLMKNNIMLKNIQKLGILGLLTFFCNSSLFALTLNDLDGNKVNLDFFLKQGKWTIVEIWASHCAICRQHMPQMVEFDGKLKNVQLLGITLDGKGGIDQAKAFVKQYQIPFTTLVSNSLIIDTWFQEIAQASLNGTPTFVVFDPKGKIAAMQAGPVPVSSFENFIRKKTMFNP